jgi:hypothetical protein
MNVAEFYKHLKFSPNNLSSLLFMNHQKETLVSKDASENDSAYLINHFLNSAPLFRIFHKTDVT